MVLHPLGSAFAEVPLLGLVVCWPGGGGCLHGQSRQTEGQMCSNCNGSINTVINEVVKNSNTGASPSLIFIFI